MFCVASELYVIKTLCLKAFVETLERESVEGNANIFVNTNDKLNPLVFVLENCLP